ncbi:hypothetical protein MTO96_050281, partial [Rhipicephalus appendiculatus]
AEPEPHRQLHQQADSSVGYGVSARGVAVIWQQRQRATDIATELCSKLFQPNRDAARDHFLGTCRTDAFLPAQVKAKHENSSTDDPLDAEPEPHRQLHQQADSSVGYGVSARGVAVIWQQRQRATDIATELCSKLFQPNRDAARDHFLGTCRTDAFLPAQVKAKHENSSTDDP